MMSWSIWKVILELNGACLLLDFATAFGKRVFFPTPVHHVQRLRWAAATAAATKAKGVSNSKHRKKVLRGDKVPLYYEDP